MSDEHLLFKIENKTGFATINREAKKNSISPEAVSLFHRHLDEARDNPDIRVICITGAGDSAFCTGAELGDGLTEASKDLFSSYAGLIKKIYTYPKPTVARVNGYCLAGGMGLMLACDVVIASDNAKFGTPEVNVGLWPMMIGALIFRNVMRKKAMEMILLGERLSAAEALAMGLITRIAPADTLDEAVAAVIAQLSSKSPIGVQIGKEAFHRMAGMQFEEALDYLSGKFAEVARTDDAREGITAFLQKRPPVFKGR
jgi:enoyl-CoA hydratase/carnithine racemase